MNITVPVSWLREYLKTDIAAKTMASYLSLAGPSVEHIAKQGEDLLLDVEVTTNRPDSASIFGLAREANAILIYEGEKSKVVEPPGLNISLQADSSTNLPLDVLIKNPKLCPRFTALIIDNVKIGPSPAYIKNRLEACGIRAINNIVDITNYVMLELGQPMHAYDYDKIEGAKMIMRESKEGEKVKTLDGVVRSMPTGTIVIQDAKKITDLCGIMGGANSQITSRTKRVIMYAQAYDPIRIRKTTQAMAFRTEAAAKFEKGVDLEGIAETLARSIYLAKKIAGAKIASELIDIYPTKQKPQTIKLSKNKLDNYLGVELEITKAANILELLGFQTKLSQDSIAATPPSYRTQDCQTEEDLVEEIARIYGYHRLPSQVPTGEIPQTRESDLEKVLKLKNALKYMGLTEVISYSIISKEFLALTGQTSAVELANPLSSEWQFMRPTLLVSLASIIGQNQNMETDAKIFEIAKTYLKNKGGLPTQDLFLSVGLQKGDFYQIKGVAENIFDVLRLNAKYQTTKEGSLFVKNESADIIVDDITVGSLGILNSRINDQLEIHAPIAALEINLSKVYNVQPNKPSYKQIPKFPSIIEDISAIFGKTAQVAEITSEIKKAGSPLAKTVEVVDVFMDEKIGEGKKSVTIRISYQKADSTPTQEEVTIVREKILKHLEKSFFAVIRK